VPQTTTAINVVDAVVELSTNGTSWTNVSGSTNKVEISPQTADSGMAASLEGQYKIVRAGKYNPVDITVTILFTETAAEAYAILHGQKEVAGRPLYLRYTPGGYDGVYRWYTADSNGAKAAARIVEFPYPGADAENAGPHLVVFKLQAITLTRENNQPSPSASVSPSASSSA
jgi:hypothetical protein